jgi:hypothetical protein
VIEQPVREVDLLVVVVRETMRSVRGTVLVFFLQTLEDGDATVRTKPTIRLVPAS